MDFVRLCKNSKMGSLMSFLSAAFLTAFLSQTLVDFLETVCLWRFGAVARVLVKLLTQFFDCRVEFVYGFTQRIDLLYQHLILLHQRLNKLLCNRHLLHRLSLPILYHN